MRRLSLFLAAALIAGAGLAQSAPNDFRIDTTPSGTSTSIRPAPAYVDARVLAANVSETHTIPTGAGYVLFSASCAAFYALTGASAAVPAADVTDGTGSELNPAAWRLSSTATQITVIAPTTCVVTLAFYK